MRFLTDTFRRFSFPALLLSIVGGLYVAADYEASRDASLRRSSVFERAGSTVAGNPSEAMFFVADEGVHGTVDPT